ncbi:DGQHR domain-containing protein [Woeseia oceani]|uniref:DGQHR domain-containing protein n=1 Tax=Woeseia oceani TaxID=1548547 RepID=A0A193LI20_9GAMM|nr:DGQHR domain-containing protein [Woeseia oceani]ANO52141.1 hypothetical protein BA177_13900 [Woeseia oceani]
MSKAKTEQIALPALRGIMGDWVFYSCLMDIVEISDRVQYAAEVHQNKQLSDMIQRQLKTGRSDQISKYLKTQPERFFNSLVVATYGGDPNWHALSDIRSKAKKPDLKDLDDDTIGSVGFLTLRGDEKLFALDGQHRLAGIKKTVKDGLDQDPHDELSVIFVAHKETAKGLERTRRLFTTLNKTARPVSKGDIIALDEDDAMAICVRRLIEKTDMFAGTRVAFVASNNMPVKNTSSLTTIGNLYDVLTILFTNSRFDLKKKKADLQRVRPPDEELDAYFKYAKSYFTALRRNFEELDEFFDAEDSSAVVGEYRGSHGGNALFRPIGLEIFTRIVATLTSKMSLAQAVKQAALLPRDLNEEPFADLMWDTSTSTMLNSHKVTLREILLYMLDCSKYSEGKLLDRYRRETGDDEIELPDQLV